MIIFPIFFITPFLSLPKVTWHFSHQTVSVLAKHTISLEKRYPVEFVNNVFRDNILLDIAYITGKEQPGQPVSWENIEKPFHYTLSLSPKQTFAFHSEVLPSYQGKTLSATPVHFSASEGFKSDGYLIGDGVCHLASLMYWTAMDANLTAYAPIRHDFAPIPQVPAKYGVAIFADDQNSQSGEEQNLYITNPRSDTVTITFDYDGKNLGVTITDIKKTS